MNGNFLSWLFPIIILMVLLDWLWLFASVLNVASDFHSADLALTATSDHIEKVSEKEEWKGEQINRV